MCVSKVLQLVEFVLAVKRIEFGLVASDVVLEVGKAAALPTDSGSIDCA